MENNNNWFSNALLNLVAVVTKLKKKEENSNSI